LLDLGAYFSFAGSALDPRKTRARESLRKIPRERLLVETDSPDLPLPPEMLSAPVMREI
jgi:TatD DNase family protein